MKASIAYCVDGSSGKFLGSTVEFSNGYQVTILKSCKQSEFMTLACKYCERSLLHNPCYLAELQEQAESEGWDD